MAVLTQPLGDQPGSAEHLLEDGDDEHPREEVRQIDDCLDPGPHPCAHDRVDEQRDGDRDGEEQDELGDEDDQRVDEDFPEAVVLEDPGEVVEADEGAAGDAQVVHVVVLEGHDVPEQRDVVEEQQQRDGRQGHQHQGAVAPQPLAPGDAPRLRSGTRRRLFSRPVLRPLRLLRRTGSARSARAGPVRPYAASVLAVTVTAAAGRGSGPVGGAVRVGRDRGPWLHRVLPMSCSPPRPPGFVRPAAFLLSRVRPLCVVRVRRRSRSCRECPGTSRAACRRRSSSRCSRPRRRR